MNIDELIGDITTELHRQFQDRRKDLEGDDITTVENTIEEVLNNATDALEDDEEEAGGYFTQEDEDK